MGIIVAVSRQFGSGGSRIGRAVAQQLGFRYADRDILAEAARLLKVEADSLEPFEERTASLWDRLTMLFAVGSADTPFVPPSLPSVSESQLFDAEREVIKGIAAHDDAVIVGRGAAHILHDTPNVLKVFLHAPRQVRVSTAMAEYHLADAAVAEQVLRDSDRARSKFVRALTGRDWCDATLYDLALDTHVSGLDRAVDVIARMVPGGAQESQPSAGGSGAAR
jgi:cytidylate kinase